MLRYVVLHHTGIDVPHYDLMLDLAPDAKLATWRIPHWPPQPGDEFHRLQNHRREYLEYQGPISGGRGEVKRVATGDVEIVREDHDHLIVRLIPLGEVRLPIFPERAG